MGAPFSCPNCNAKFPEWRCVDKTNEGFSVGKALVGGFLLGRVGFFGGGSLGKKKKIYVCKKCGYSNKY